MQSGQSQLSVPLSRLVPSRSNPRRVKPSHEADQSLQALIQAYGLLQPLVVRPLEGKAKFFEVVAGHRRLLALRKIHRDDGNPKIPCILCDLDAVTADAVSLGENFGRAAMHPLDEAEAFAKLAKNDGKGVEAIAAEFGVRERYVRQRMKLAALATVVKKAYRDGKIDTAIAEAFAAVPEERQTQVWQEMNGQPRHADHVRKIIAHGWIDASHALFDVSAMPEQTVSQDLFGERVLVERQAFMAAQLEALAAERIKLIEDGWHEVVAGRYYEDIHDRPLTMAPAEREFDEQTTRKLERIANRRQQQEARLREMTDDDEKVLAGIQEKLEALDAEEREIEQNAPVLYSEATKAIATVFLILYDDGQVRREYRMPRTRPHQANGGHGRAADGSANGGQPTPPTPDDLGDKQLAVTFTHQALAVREALLKDAPARKRILAMILHDRVRSEALAVWHEPNGTTLQATSGNGFISSTFDGLKDKRAKLDPFVGQTFVADCTGYARLGELSNSKLDALIDLLTVECITAHLQRPTELVHQLAGELKVNVRKHWRPDAVWLSGFQKIQLSQLIVELIGSGHPLAPDQKKSELVEALAKMFADAATGKLEDKTLADRLNQWLPSNLREPKADTTEQTPAVKAKRS
jgi:ParB family chromosome partitioning protein